MMRQRRRERAVLAVAVGRGGTGLGRIGDQRSGWSARPWRGPARSRARHGALHGARKRIVAAGVENHQPQLLGRLDRDQDAVEREALVIDVGIALEPRIDRNEIVAAIHLDAVAGIIDHRNIGIARTVSKIAQRATGFGRRQVAAEVDDVEAGLFQRGRNPGAIVNGIGQRRDVAIGRIAQHQRHALFGERRRTDQQEAGGCKCPSAQF